MPPTPTSRLHSPLDTGFRPARRPGGRLRAAPSKGPPAATATTAIAATIFVRAFTIKAVADGPAPAACHTSARAGEQAEPLAEENHYGRGYRGFPSQTTNIGTLEFTFRGCVNEVMLVGKMFYLQNQCEGQKEFFCVLANRCKFNYVH